MTDLAAAVSRLRVERGWTKTELAARAGVAYQTVWRLEHGRTRRPPVDVVRKLADALGVKIDDLF